MLAFQYCIALESCTLRLPRHLLQSYQPETAKKLYEIYQYDDDMGWLKYFKILREKANGVINRFCDENYIFDDIDAQLLVIAG